MGGKSSYEEVNVGVTRVVTEASNGLKKLVEDEEALVSMTKDDVLSMQFATLSDAEHFYKAYVRVKGFGMRLDTLIKNKHGEPTTRRMVCSAQGSRDLKHIEIGERQREHKSLTRCDCKARLRVKLMKVTNGWHVY